MSRACLLLKRNIYKTESIAPPDIFTGVNKSKVTGAKEIKTLYLEV